MKQLMVVNDRTQSLLAWKGKIASNFGQRLIGLLGKQDMQPGEALILSPCNSVHSLFMRFAIDVIFVDSQGIAVAMITQLKPFRVVRPINRAATAIELPVGLLVATETRLGDLITWSRFEGGKCDGSD